MLTLLKSLAYGMTEAKPIQKPVVKSAPQMEAEEAPAIFPERRLWIAIIVFAIQEYEDLLLIIRHQWTKNNKRPVSKYYLQCIRSIRYEIRHDWFRHVCDLADIEQVAVIERLKKLDAQYKLADVEFTAEENVVTRYQVQKLKQFQERGGRGLKRHLN